MDIANVNRRVDKLVTSTDKADVDADGRSDPGIQ